MAISKNTAKSLQALGLITDLIAMVLVFVLISSAREASEANDITGTMYNCTLLVVVFIYLLRRS